MMYRVHRASMHEEAVQVVHDGETLSAKVPVLEVELVPSEGGLDGTLKRVFKGAAVAAARDQFVADSVHEMTLTPVA